MNRRIWSLAAIGVFLACLGVEAQHGPPSSAPLKADPAPKASDLTVAQLLAKYAAARGGEQKLKGIQSVTMKGTWESSQGTSSPVTLTIAPGRYLRRIEQSGPDGASIKALDGQTGWEVTPQAGILKPTPMISKDVARYRQLADPQGPLVNPQAKGNRVEMVGKISWQGSQVYKLKVTFRDGGVNHVYLDARSFLLVRSVGTLYVNQMGKDVALEMIYSDYRDVNGVKWPFTEKANAPEVGFTQTTSWKTIEANKPYDPAAFKSPKG